MAITNEFPITDTTMFDRLVSVTFYHVEATPPVNTGPQLPAPNKGVGPLAANVIDKVAAVDKEKSYGVTIDCPTYGVKPTIEVSYKLLPNHICYQVTVKITNFSLRGDINVRELNVMEVQIGYRGQQSQTLKGPIFSSYQESPNPDGITVFEGVVTGESGVGLLSNKPYELQFNEPEVALIDLCSGIAKALGLSLNSTHLPSAVGQQKIKVGERLSKARADNGYAVLAWLNNVLHAFCLNYDGQRHNDVDVENPLQLFLIWNEDELVIIDATAKHEDLATEQVVILGCVKTVSFSGPVLTLQALFDPAVKPGTLIYVDPIYYTGGTGLPNIMSANVFNPDQGFYRVITVDVQFSTTGNTNNMSLMAVPLSNNRENIDAKNDYARVDDISQNLASIVKVQQELVQIKFGEEPPTAEEDKPKNFWDQPYAASVREYVVQPGDTLSKIAQVQWGDGKIFYPDNKLTQTFDRTLPTGVPIYHLYPLIALATYKQGYSVFKDAPLNPYYINIDNMDALQVGKKILIPIITTSDFDSWLGNGTMMDIFKSAKDYYVNLGKIEWAKPLDDIINYLQYGKR